MKRTLTALTVAVAMFASSASAFDPDDLQTLLDTGECEGCDLSGADLREAKPHSTYLGAILREANLSGADMFRIMLFQADLSRADLSDANLEGAYLSGARLRGANLGNANLGGANLGGADLEYANMNGAILCNTTMPNKLVIYSGC